MKVLIIGSHGMLGMDLVDEFGRDFEVLGVDQEETDITRLEACYDTVNAFHPDVIINAAALTNVDYCETHEAEALRINGTGAGNIAKAAESCGALLVHYSTDYVFDGLKPDPYIEEDAPNPISAYGKSKLLGEELIRQHCPDHLILRISWLFGPRGPNFIQKITDAAKQGKKLRVVEDQIGSPTYTKDVASHTSQMVRSDFRGTFHLTNQGACSWYELAVLALKCSGMDDIPIEPVSSGEYKLPAPRPNNSLLANEHLKKKGLLPMRPWEKAVEEYVRCFLR